MSRSSIANIEGGRQPIYVHALVQIAKQLETSVASLIPSQKHDREIDSFTTRAIKRLPETERRFLNLVLQKSTPSHKERDGSQIRASKKASRRSSKTGSRQEGTRTR
jgi:transcriptional regulator with XRE-family HTH domain